MGEEEKKKKNKGRENVRFVKEKNEEMKGRK